MTAPPASGPANGAGTEWVVIDMAYDVRELQARNHLRFLEARNRGALFDTVWSIHPLAGLITGAAAGPMRFVRPLAGHVVLDGFEPARKRGRFAQFLNVLVSQLRMIAATVRIARRPQVVGISTADVFYLGLLGLVVAVFARRPLVVAAYQNQDEIYARCGALAFPRLLPFRWLEKAVQRVVLRYATLIEGPTADMRRYLVANGADPSKIVQLPVVHLIDRYHLTPPAERTRANGLERFGLDPAVPRMVMVARLIKLKMVDEGVAAMIAVCRSQPHCCGVVLGVGELEPMLRDMIAAAGLQDRIILAGKVDQPTVAAIAAGAVIISPFTGMALVETSLAGGVPVVYDCDWQPEFVRDGVNGFVVPFHSVADMAKRAGQLVADPPLLQRMSVNARQAGLHFADPAAQKEREIAALAQLLAGRCGRDATVR